MQKQKILVIGNVEKWKVDLAFPAPQGAQEIIYMPPRLQVLWNGHRAHQQSTIKQVLSWIEQHLNGRWNLNQPQLHVVVDGQPLAVYKLVNHLRKDRFNPKRDQNGQPLPVQVQPYYLVDNGVNVVAKRYF